MPIGTSKLQDPALLNGPARFHRADYEVEPSRVPAKSAAFSKPTYSQAVLLGLVILACTVDASRSISIAGVSGLGSLSLAAGGAVWAAWMLRPVLPKGLLHVFLPLMLFGLDALGTLLWYRPEAMDGVQLLVVGLTFLGTMMLAARESAADPNFAWKIRALMLVTSAIPVFVWMGLLLSGIVPKEDANFTRPFALYVLPVMAVALATWRGYAWPEPIHGQPPARKFGPIKSLWPLLWLAITAYVVLLGMSRTALIAIALMVPLSLIYRGNLKNIVRGMLLMAIGAAVFATAVMNYQPLHDRFFGEDAHLQVGGVAINGSGRTQIWNILFTTIGDDWMFGKGISSSEDIINRTMNGIGQPHNDYLRFYYDQGVLGLCIWFCFIATFVNRTVINLRRSIHNRTPDYSTHLAALLALTGVAVSMTTDNSYCYAFVMFPLAILMGCSLGQGAHYAQVELEALPVEESAYFQRSR